MWTDDDKIGFEQLNAELQEILNAKTTVENFRSWTNEFDKHRKDHLVHLTQDDRDHFEYAYDRVKRYLDNNLDGNIDDMRDIIANYNSHVNDNVAHWTSNDRNDYNTFVENTNKKIEKLYTTINQERTTSDSRYVPVSDYSSLVADVNNHKLNMISHITPSERSKWNGILDEAKEYVDGLMYTHTVTKSNLHISDDERLAWNSHRDDGTLHVTSEEKHLYSNHVNNNSIHIDQSERVKWNNYEQDIYQNTNDIRYLRTEIATLSEHIATIIRTLNTYVGKISND